MTPVFANSAYVHTLERLILKGGGLRRVALKVRYGIAVHPTAGPVLIDAGYGQELYDAPARGLALRLYAKVLGPELRPACAPTQVLARMGYQPRDVKHIVLTHLHADHVCALARFPQAQVHTSRAVLEAVLARPARHNLRHGIFTELLPRGLLDRVVDVDSQPRVAAPLTLGEGRDILGDGTMLAIDLPGHAEGHFGVCFAQMDSPLLYAVDTQWMPQALDGARIPGFPASLVADDGAALRASVARVAGFAQAGGQVLLCHEPGDSAFDLPEPLA